MVETVTAEDYIKSRGLDRVAISSRADRLRAYVRAYELREARKDKGLTQKQLASNMGVSQKRISELENGRVESLRVDTLRRYAQGIGGSLHMVIEFPVRAGQNDLPETIEIPLEG